LTAYCPTPGINHPWLQSSVKIRSPQRRKSIGEKSFRGRDRRQKSEDRSQKSEDRRQKTEVRRQKTEGRIQKTGDRGQKSEDRG